MTSTGLWHRWERTAKDAPQARALINSATGESFTRSFLREQAEKLSESFALFSPRVVAFAEPNGPGWLRAFLAVQRVGAAALPLDAALPEKVRSEAARAYGANLLLASGRPVRLDRGTEPPDAAWPEPDVCLLKLTSGTNAAARALPFTSDQMLADGRQVCAGMGIGPADLNFGAIPFGHSYGLGNLVVPLLTQGTPVAFSDEALPGGVAEAVARVGATVFPTVPAVLRGLAESPAVDATRLAGVRLIVSAGAFLRPTVVTDFYVKFRKLVHNFYGSTETGGICYDADGEATLTGRSVGQPLPAVQVEVEAPEAVVRVTSPAATFPGTHRLADRAEWNEQGELRLLGRTGTVANVGGRKVDPAEIERVLRALPAVTDAWVGVRTRPGGDDYLVAAVETRRSREEILTLLAGQLSGWQVPRRLIALTLFPRTTRGKTDREKLEAKLGS